MWQAVLQMEHDRDINNIIIKGDEFSIHNQCNVINIANVVSKINFYSILLPITFGLVCRYCFAENLPVLNHSIMRLNTALYISINFIGN